MPETNKTNVVKTGEEEFVWKFRIPDITPVFKEVNNKIFKKIDEPDVYTCDDEHHLLVDKYINEGYIYLYTVGEEPLRTPSKRYEVEEGRFMIYDNKSSVKNGEMVWEEYGYAITDNFYMVLDEDIGFDDGIEKIRKWRGKIISKSGKEFKFDFDARLFANPQDMAKLLLGVAGAKVEFDNAKLKDIRIAMQSTSKYISREVSQIFGWHSPKVYQTQSSTIMHGAVVKKDEGSVDLSNIGHAKNLDMVVISDKKFKEVGNHILNDLMNMHGRYPIDCLFGFTFLAPISFQLMRSDDWSGGRIGMWIIGGSGCGKTYTSLLFQNFFGDFKGSKSVLSWTATPYSIQETGYYYKDAIYMVDDFKISHFSQNSMNSVVTVLQNYADGTSRTRLAPDSSIREGKPIQGSLLITGEDIIEDVGSIVARYHVVEMDKDQINRESGKAAYKYRKFYNGFMGRYIAWLTKDPNVIKKIVNRIEATKDKFVGQRMSANIDRVAQSFAYNLVGFEMFCRFMEESGFISTKKRTEMVKIHKNNLFLEIEKNVMDVKDSTVSEIFINTLADLINSGSVKINTVTKDLDTPKDFHDKYVGFDDGDPEYLYFFGTLVLAAVNDAVKSNTGRGLQNSKINLTSELVKKGVMMPGAKGNTFPKWLYGKTQITWKIQKSALGYDKGDVLDKYVEAAEADADGVDGDELEKW